MTNISVRFPTFPTRSGALTVRQGAALRQGKNEPPENMREEIPVVRFHWSLALKPDTPPANHVIENTGLRDFVAG